MHIPDGFLDPKMSSGLLGAAAGVLGYCLGKVMKAVTAVVGQRVLATVGNSLGNIQMAGRRMVTEIGKEKLQKMGLVAAWIFSAQMFNFPIGQGTSGHLIGGVFAAVILGPFAGTVVIAAVLAVQSLFFADGGLMALGANIVNMAVIGSLASYYIYAALKKALPEVLSIAIAAWCSVVLAAAACSLEIGFSGTIGLTAVTSAMLKIHALIGVFEAVITVLLLRFFGKEKAK
jgi:cobalt/nickel transport system permease protein